MPHLSASPVRAHAARGRSRREMGAASLIVVLILFFVMSMVGAYTNRNLIFEQRTSANQQRSTAALEAAEAGMEWALTMLNTGRVTDTCLTSANPADLSFRQRYLAIDEEPTDSDAGFVRPRKWLPPPVPPAPAVPTDYYPSCVRTGGAWQCSCPTDASPTMAAVSGTEIAPAFRVRFRRMCAVATAPDTACVDPVQPQVIHIDVNGCTTPAEDCLAFPGRALANEGRATLHVVAALKAALPVPPAAAFTAKGTFDASLLVYNTSQIEKSGAITIHAGSTVSGASQLFGPAGTPGDRTVVQNDTVLAGLDATRMFTNTFGLWKNSYRDQPGTIVVDCSATCNASTVRARVALNPGRVLWLDGDVSFDSAGDIGTADEPVALVVNGNITFPSAVTITGLVYSQAATWTSSGSGKIVGAAIAEGNYDGTASTEVVFDPTVLTRLRTRTGTFVKVPGTWKDFES